MSLKLWQVPKYQSSKHIKAGETAYSTKSRLSYLDFHFHLHLHLNIHGSINKYSNHQIYSKLSSNLSRDI
ncbi:predicted protein [Botrytis cinerea T4]|uniref:Uncharacterized protein n=1 Tax=Botryotinia fuckeliana (strain T4) TaxID=999810 RepID=G2Y360_BOTF4|nr:predicted protein [Botrytis cinerea T4]